MKVLVLHYYCGYFDGTFSSMVDTYYNLLKYKIDVEFKIISYPDVGRTIIDIPANFGTNDLLNITTDKCFVADIIICSSCLIYNHFSVPLNELVLKANKIIILDSLDIQLSKLSVVTQYGVIPPLHEATEFDNCILLCNPSNIGNCEFKTHIYYHKFSHRRLLNPIHRKRILKSIDNVKTYQYSRILRHKKYEDHSPVVHENIGKIIFECIYYGVNVNYSADGYVSDGLSCYLELFDIEASVNHFPLPLDSDDIEQKLFMTKSDRLLRIINGG